MKNIHDDIEDWHKGYAGDLPLHLYLGMSREAYGKWVELKMTEDELAMYGYYDK